jgi:hypothetical protein
MNPSDLKLYDVEADLIAARITGTTPLDSLHSGICAADLGGIDVLVLEFRKLHGMADPEDQRPLFYGFLVRGKPFAFFKKLAADLVQLRKTTRAALLKEGKKTEVDAIEGVAEAAK